MSFEIQNLGDDNYADVEVQLVLPLGMVACFEPRDFGWEKDLSFPTAPGGSGGSYLDSLTFAAPLRANVPPPPPRGWVDHHDDGAVVTFAPEDLRPLRSVPLWSVYVMCLDAQVDGEGTVRWSAASKTASGQASGTIVIKVRETTMSVCDIVQADGAAPKPARPDDE